ncbi:MAG TPA: hypothetical protein VEL07_10780 [Planctomycetota bacterium]|nr:hypothetical protein [Planctomycetota bacterium]
MSHHSRRGTILILVAGLAAVLASLCVAFLMRMRSDAEETTLVEREIQSRIMLLAGCGYVLEAGRLGWDVDPHADPLRDHVEAFGWIDIRDEDAVGPRDQRGDALFSDDLVVDTDDDGTADQPAWPAVGSTARCPMHAWSRPPYAIQPTVAYNPIDVSDPGSVLYGLPLLLRPDPQPAVDNGWTPAAPGAVSDARFDEFSRGDARPRSETTGLAWFRVHRESPSVFVITTGAGGSLGYRDWREVTADGAEDAFPGPAAFAQTVGAEARLHHRIEWSPETIEQTETAYQYHLQNDAGRGLRNPWVDSPIRMVTNMSLESPGGSSMHVAMKRAPNHLGSVKWVQRLETPPARW